MAENVAEFTDSNFDEQVIKSDKLTVVDFWAEWCAPCRMIAPIIEELATTYDGKVSMGKLNVDDSGDTARKYNIRSIPTILFFKDGEVVKQVVGVRPKEEIVKVIDENL